MKKIIRYIFDEITYFFILLKKVRIKIYIKNDIEENYYKYGFSKEQKEELAKIIFDKNYHMPYFLREIIRFRKNILKNKKYYNI